LTISTRVAGIDFVLSPEALGEILDVPSNIPITDTENIVDPDYPGWDEACIALKIPHIKRNEDRQKDSLRINLAKPRVRVLQFLVAKNVTPKSSNYGEARHLDIYHLWKMLFHQNAPLNLPALILEWMHAVRGERFN